VSDFHAQISDDEDDTHPNVDTASLFKWRHEARVKRKEEEAQEQARKEAQSRTYVCALLLAVPRHAL
jgi:cell division cycle protein 37